MWQNKNRAVIGTGVQTATLLCVGLSMATAAPSAKAAFVFDLQQVGGNVVVTGSRSINTAGLTSPNSIPFGAQIATDVAFVVGGSPTDNAVTQFMGPT
jgi:hypothetical protein